MGEWQIKSLSVLPGNPPGKWPLMSSRKATPKKTPNLLMKSKLLNRTQPRETIQLLTLPWSKEPLWEDTKWELRSRATANRLNKLTVNLLSKATANPKPHTSNPWPKKRPAALTNTRNTNMAAFSEDDVCFCIKI